MHVTALHIDCVYICCNCRSPSRGRDGRSPKRSVSHGSRSN